MRYLFPLSVKKSSKAQNSLQPNFSDFHYRAEVLIESSTNLKVGYSENPSTVLKQSGTTSAIQTILEMVAMSEARTLSVFQSLRYLKRLRVYSSRYLHEAQIHLARLSLNLATSKERKRQRTSSSLECSKLLNIFGKDSQTEPPKITDAKAIEEIYSAERASALAWTLRNSSFTLRSSPLFYSMNELTVFWANIGVTLISLRTLSMPAVCVFRNLSSLIASISLIP